MLTGIRFALLYTSIFLQQPFSLHLNMKILSAEQIRAWDKYTIENEPVSSIDLMERAAKQCTDWIIKHYANGTFIFFCGK